MGASYVYGSHRRMTAAKAFVLSYGKDSSTSRAFKVLYLFIGFTNKTPGQPKRLFNQPECLPPEVLSVLNSGLS